ncbi:helix-turn-helix domain-containing protein [Streptomyces sp. NPDC015184]|uniref:helix-turn-helix domain-containing protein n=1 Tax=Streptomyces sp. NPDC015184 TaxID=3364946 RepID=UPI0037002162
MSRNGQLDELPDFPFPATPGGPPGVEVTDLPGLTARIRRLGVEADAPVRLAFHLLVTVRSGRLPCSVDTTDCVAGSGSWLWVRPGQLFRLRPTADRTGAPWKNGEVPYPTPAPATAPANVPMNATVVLFQASFLNAVTVDAARLDRRAWRLPLSPAPGAAEPVERTLELLESQYHRPRDLPLEVHVEVVRHLLSVLVLRLSHLPGGHRKQAAGDETFRRFRAAVESNFAHSHQVQDYAAMLGYSVRSLTRASNAAVGRSAKALIDDRLVLEAKRLLVHTRLPAYAIADRLGFPGTTVFTRFFRHRTAETPTGFRRRARAEPIGTD